MGAATRQLSTWATLAAALLLGATASVGVAAPSSSIELVRDIHPGPDGSDPSSLTVVGDQLYFAADDGKTGEELWVSRGPQGRTRMVADIQPEQEFTSDSSFPSCLNQLGDLLLFEANGQLWRADSRPDQVTVLSEVEPRCGDGAALVVGDYLYFAGQDGKSGNELWVTDGTVAGTRMVADIAPSFRSSWPAEFVAIGQTLFFSAVDAEHGRELWRTDGTADGTEMVADLNPLGNGVGEPGFTGSAVIGNTLYFEGSDGATGFELWRTDGTAQGTRRVADISPGPSSSHPSEITALGDAVYFNAYDHLHHHELWRSDGTLTGTRMVVELHPSGSSSPEKLIAVGDMLVFQAFTPETGRELWRTDGTAAGTTLVADIAPGTDSSYPGGGWWQFEIVVDDAAVLYFPATDGVSGAELWRSDGTGSGTWMVDDLRPGPASGSPLGLTLVGTELYLTADDGTSGRELYRWSLPG